LCPKYKVPPFCSMTVFFNLKSLFLLQQPRQVTLLQ
jgi:hypothetical protein